MEEETLEIHRCSRIRIWFPDGERGGGGGREGDRARLTGVGVLRELFRVGDWIGGSARSEDGWPGFVAGGGGGGRSASAGDGRAGEGGGGAVLGREVFGVHWCFESVAGEERGRSKGKFIYLLCFYVVVLGSRFVAEFSCKTWIFIGVDFSFLSLFCAFAVLVDLVIS